MQKNLTYTVVLSWSFYFKVSCETVELYLISLRWFKSVLGEEGNKCELLYFEFKGQKETVGINGRKFRKKVFFDFHILIFKKAFILSPYFHFTSRTASHLKNDWYALIHIMCNLLKQVKWTEVACYIGDHQWITPPGSCPCLAISPWIWAGPATCFNQQNGVVVMCC